MNKIDFQNKEVAAVFDAAPREHRDALLALRARIFAVAQENDIEISEELRWGQPAYLAPNGSTLRVNARKLGGFAIYAHCGTSLISDYAALVPTARIEPKRAVHFADAEEAEAQPLELLIRAALTYHLNR